MNQRPSPHGRIALPLHIVFQILPFWQPLKAARLNYQNKVAHSFAIIKGIFIVHTHPSAPFPLEGRKVAACGRPLPGCGIVVGNRMSRSPGLFALTSMLLSLQSYEVETVLGKEMGPLLCFVESITTQQTSCITLEEMELLSAAGATTTQPPS